MAGSSGGNEHDSGNGSHRHTTHQIKEMKSFFRVCQHPNDEERLQLSHDLGLKPSQVKFWFQNRRTQMKAQQDRSERSALKSENEKLKTENYKLQEARRNSKCPQCSGGLEEVCSGTQELGFENARLREEYERISAIASRMSQFVDLKPSLMQLALSSINELFKMCRAAEPLWIQRSDGIEVLNLQEYARMFPRPISHRQHPNHQFRTEASRETGVVFMSSRTIIDTFLDADKWIQMFPCMISNAKTVDIIAGSGGNSSGSLHLMHAEMQMLSPLVPTTQVHFLRYCHQADQETWAIVDFPFNSLKDCDYATPSPTYRRKLSGCVIQDMPNGYSSRVTWVEHVEVEDTAVHQIFNRVVSSGMAFGAAKWLAVLGRQCERLVSLTAHNIYDLGEIPSPQARTNLINLATRMMRTFCVSLSTSSGQSWRALSDSPEDTVRISMRTTTEPGHPIGLILSAASTTWLPYSHQQVFDLLRDERRRAQMKILSNGNSLYDLARIPSGSHPGNCISYLRIDGPNRSTQTEFMLQESYTDISESVVAYTTLDIDGASVAMFGTDPSIIPILPLGFVIVPMNQINRTTAQFSSNRNIQQESGCLLTVGLQILASTDQNAMLNLSSATAIKNRLHNTFQQIKKAFARASTGRCHEATAIYVADHPKEPPSGPEI